MGSGTEARGDGLARAGGAGGPGPGVEAPETRRWERRRRGTARGAGPALSPDAAAGRAAERLCTACGGRMRPFLEIPEVPVASCLLMPDEEEARECPRGDLRLGFCAGCGFVRNLAFDPGRARYSERYEETQGYSPTFRRFHERLARELIERHDLRGKRVVEIGCGKGEFLALLCRLGPNVGVGFDPAFDPDRGVLAGLPHVRVERSFFTSGTKVAPADLVCCKMTLEHVRPVARFVRDARGALRPGSRSVAFFQVPDADRILRECAFEDLYYEHCSYFTPGSLARLFRSEGYEVERISSLYGGQYLAIEARYTDGFDGFGGVPLEAEEPPEETARLVERFADRYRARVGAWRRRLREAARRGSVALWGSGSKAVAFLSAADPEGVVGRVVDVNPHRQGTFMPGSGRPIVAPGTLRRDPPATVVVMNPVYREEIAADLDGMGLAPRLLVLGEEDADGAETGRAEVRGEAKAEVRTETRGEARGEVRGEARAEGAGR